MLKKRVAATLVVREGIVVQSIGFARYLPVGRPAVAVEFLNQWGIDEIILLDISATRQERGPDYAMVKGLAQYCRVPLTVGGGITHLNHISELMHCGADRVAFNQAVLRQPELLTAASNLFGAQCVVVSIDSHGTDTGYQVHDYLQGSDLGLHPSVLAHSMQERGAGEILIHSVDRDGSYQGFDLTLVNSVCSAVSIPVICSGGAGHPMHFLDVFKGTSACAATAANFFHFSEHSVTRTKALLAQHLPVRHETTFDYAGAQFDADGRLLKKPDQVLDEMLFEKIEKEVI